jgi:hypothetical protein
MSGLQYTDVLKTYIAGLTQLSSAFSQMYVLGEYRAGTERLGPSLENCQQVILACLPKDWSYLSADGKRIPAGLDSYTRNGFVNTLATTLDYEADGAVVETTMGSIDAESGSSLIVRLRGAELTAAEFLRKLFKYTVTSWEPAYAYLEVEAPEVMQDNARLDEIPLGWLTYLADLRLLTSVSQGVHVERCGAGVLIQVPGGDEPSRHPDYAGRLRDLRETLRFAGLLTDPLTSGSAHPSP